MRDTKNWLDEIKNLAYCVRMTCELLAHYRAPARANGTPAAFRGAPALRDENVDIHKKGVAPAKTVAQACERLGWDPSYARFFSFAPWKDYETPGDTVTWHAEAVDLGSDAPAVAVALCDAMHAAMADMTDALTALLRVPPRTFGPEPESWGMRYTAARALALSVAEKLVPDLVGAYWVKLTPPVRAKATPKPGTSAKAPSAARTSVTLR